MEVRFVRYTTPPERDDPYMPGALYPQKAEAALATGKARLGDRSTVCSGHDVSHCQRSREARTAVTGLESSMKTRLNRRCRAERRHFGPPPGRYRTQMRVPTKPELNDRLQRGLL